jgi:sialate O-acetylesterase
MVKHMRWFALLFVTISVATGPARAELRLPSVIGDHAMLQAGKPIAIWGWATPSAEVKVAFVSGDPNHSDTFIATSDKSGKWSGLLPALKAGSVGELQIGSDKDGRTTLHDIVVGEVWLGGGQSNMVYDVAGKKGGNPNDPEEVAEVARNVVIAQKEADTAKQAIRYFAVASSGADQPADDVKGAWVQADSTNVTNFSAVAWNFAVALQNKLHVPIGLVVSCVGGTPVESWMSKETLESTKAGAAVMDRHTQALAAVTPEAIAKHDAEQKTWRAANPTPDLQLKNAASRPKPIYTATSGQAPVRLYNGMIHGLEPYTLRGVIWFQADGNMAHPLEYSELFQALIKQWRADWKVPLPFFFVEMNNMREDIQTQPVQPHPLALIREQQHGGLLLPGTGMVAAIDLGTKNAHFPNKKPVGERLAGLALRDCYGQPGQANSPMLESFTIESNKIRLTFTDAEGLRVRGGGDLKGFAIRGRQGDWVWATGKFDGQNIVVWSDQVPAPAAVRYAWASNPVISVENGAGLPLYPFRTDTDSKE